MKGTLTLILVAAGLSSPHLFAGGGTFAQQCKDIIGDRGAAAVMDLQTGQLIAATDPEMLFAKRFPPGSVAKILTAVVALDKGVELPEKFICEGREIRDSRTLLCSVGDGHGEVDFDAALISSCNLYFLNLADELTGEDLASIYRELRLDGRVGVDLPGEVESIVSTPATDSAKSEFAIGQGSSIQLTPAAVLCLISGVATGGQLLRPRLSEGPPEVLSSFPSQRALYRIRPLLRQAVKRGTAKEAELASVEVAGKTGTSTVLGDWVTHGWFAGFAPYDAPRIAVVVFLRRGEGKDAAGVAGQVISTYMRGNHAGS